MRQHQPHDVDEAAARESRANVMSDMVFSPIVYCPQIDAEIGAGPEDAARAGSRVLAPPEGLAGFSKRLFLGDADVLQEVKVVALGDFAQRPALAGAREPSADCRARAGDEPADRRFRMGRSRGAAS